MPCECMCCPAKARCIFVGTDPRSLAGMPQNIRPTFCYAVEDMARIGSKLLSSIEPHREHKFGFHVPPWNSVDHLHMHCFALPHRGCTALKYQVTEAAWAGYMTAAQAVERLQPRSARHIRSKH